MGFFYKGGGEKVVMEQASRLRRRGHDVKVFSPVIYWDKTYAEVKSFGARRMVPHLPIPFPFRESSAMLASALLPFGVESMKDCDVLLCHSQPSMWIGFRMNQLYGIPYVGYLHQLTTFIHSRPSIAGNWNTKDFAILQALVGRGPSRSIFRHLDKLSHRKASCLLFNSNHTRSLFQKEYHIDGKVCYPGIAPPMELSVDRLGRSLLMAARQYSWKRIDLALEVVRRLHRLKGLDLTITGKETELGPRLVNLAKQLGVSDMVSFVGETSSSDLARLYAKSSIYIQTSIYEPFGMASLEAQSYGTPAVVWGDAGLRETVLDGRTGFHAKPYDVQDFASKVGYLIQDKKAWMEMSSKAREWAMLPQFSWETHVDVVEETLRTAIDRS
jgi:glycosyltransferase involved in cell wall biosynthesis